MNEDEPPESVQFRDIAPAVEFTCWVIVGLAPMLRLINGPAVTEDQLIIQISLFSLALLGGIGMRIYSILRQ
jgi:hypothetical protein